MAEFSLKLTNWNARSIAGKKLETAEFLIGNQIDVALFTETFLKPNTSFSIPQYTIVRLDRTTSAGGGVALAIRNGIKFRSLPSFHTHLIEAIGVELYNEDNPISIIAAYCPTQASARRGLSSRFKNDLRKLTRRPGKFILAGDLNARYTAWGNAINNVNGRLLAEDAQHGNYVVLHPDTPTYFSRAGVGSTLDIFLTNFADYITTPRTVSALSSDHLPVIAELNMVIQQQQLMRRNYHRANWIQFQTSIERRVNDDIILNTTEDINSALASFTSLVRKLRIVSFH